MILDMVGGDYVERNWKAAAVEGRICQIATLRGVAETVNFSRLMVKRLTHTGSTLRPRDDAFKTAIADRLKDKVWPLIEQGKDQAGDGLDLSARPGRGGTRADRKLRSYRQKSC
ncbi:hypothetical protein QW131_20140 [Roseibium salinum]|nr:hypothetical protein [Roseibium salinum]